MLQTIGHIVQNIVLPILITVGVGALLQRYRPVSMESLTRVTLWLLVPSFLIVKIYDSDIPWNEIGRIAMVFALPLGSLGVLLFLCLRAAHVHNETVAGTLLGGLVFNAGNFGVPVAYLLYIEGMTLFVGQPNPQQGLQVQALVVMFCNLLIWGIGYMVLALAKGGRLRAALGIFTLPMPYALTTAFVLRSIRLNLFDGADFLPTWISFPLRSFTAALVPMMLIALGAQLASGARWPRWSAVLPIASIKLLIVPAATAAAVYSFGLWPWPGAQLIIGSAAPTAVNTLILTLELDGDARLAGDVVFWTTVFSGVTVASVIAIVVALGTA